MALILRGWIITRFKQYFNKFFLAIVIMFALVSYAHVCLVRLVRNFTKEHEGVLW